MNALLESRSFLDATLISTELGYFDIYLLALIGFGIGLYVASQIWSRAEVEEIVEVVKPPVPKPPVVVPDPPVAPDSRVGDSKRMFTNSEEGEELETAKRYVYIMDVSKSLTDNQFALCKSELSGALEKLPESFEYQVIFFSGSTWFAHQRMIAGGSKGENVVIQDGDETLNWSSGFGGFQYEKGNHNLPKGSWRKATADNKEATLRDINEVKRSFGTTWHLPFMLAMNLEEVPDEIYFLTDGKTAHQHLVGAGIVDMVRARGPKTKVYTRALMVKDAAEPLQRIARKTAGEYLLIDPTGV